MTSLSVQGGNGEKEEGKQGVGLRGEEGSWVLAVVEWEVECEAEQGG